MTPRTTQYVWGLGYVNALVLRDDNSTSGNLGKTGSGLGRRLFFQQDANYNVTAETSTSGNVLQRQIYTAYGTMAVLSASWTSTSDIYNLTCTFQGGRADPVTGLIHFGFREYSPSLGRWVQQDPAGYVDGPDVYSFECDSSIGTVDPLGLSATFIQSSTPPPNGYASAIAASNASWNSWKPTGLQRIEALAWRSQEVMAIKAGIVGGLGAYVRGDGMLHASAFLDHFLDGSGTPLAIDPSDLINGDGGASKAFWKAVDDAAWYIDRNGGRINSEISTVADYRTFASGMDWRNALGSYRWWAAADYYGCNTATKEQVMEFKWFVRDNYEWVLGSKKKFGFLYDNDLAMMHRLGYAREFPIFGNVSVFISWKRGMPWTAKRETRFYDNTDPRL